MQRRQFGFSALELSLVMLLIGLLAALGLSAWQQAGASNQRLGLQAEARDIKQRLRAFALERDRLPCADREGNGWESRSGDGCQQPERLGWLPYRTLDMAMPATDRRAAYAVHAPLATVVGAEGSSLRPGHRLARRLRDAAGMDSSSGLLHIAASSGDALNIAFAVVLPGEDRNGNGSGFEAPHWPVPGNSLSVASPRRGADAEYDDVVVAESFTGLLGVVGPAR